FTFGAERVVGLRLTQIVPFGGVLHDDVAHVVDDIRVVAGPADQRVRAGLPVQDVVRTRARQRISEAVAGAIERAGAGKSQGVDIGGQDVGDRRLDRVVARARTVNPIAGIVDDVRVVAATAGHAVGAGSAIEKVGPGASDQRVVTCIAIELAIADTGGQRVVAGGSASNVELVENRRGIPRGTVGEA